MAYVRRKQTEKKIHKYNCTERSDVYSSVVLWGNNNNERVGGGISHEKIISFYEIVNNHLHQNRCATNETR